MAPYCANCCWMMCPAVWLDQRMVYFMSNHYSDVCLIFAYEESITVKKTICPPGIH
ncbi:MAG: hypothetical protein ACMUEM_05870 [Flavobacteriales bacterium AspAUS03]